MRKRQQTKAVDCPETLNSIDDDEEEGNQNKGKRFFACYLLTSLCPRYKGHTYIGFTVNPRRRIRQHNGEIRCGAWRTKKRRPWEMVLCIYGFPTNVSALQFEWAWQHPSESLAVRQAAASFKSFSGVANKIKLAYTMLNLPNWQSLNITVNYFSTKYSTHSASCPSLPDHMKVQVCAMDELPCYTGIDEILFGDEDSRDNEVCVEASENSGSLEDTSGDAAINNSADYLLSTDKVCYEQCGLYEHGNEKLKETSNLEVDCQQPLGLINSLDTLSSIISDTSAEETDELGRSKQYATTVNADENQEPLPTEKQTKTAEVANKDQQKVQNSTVIKTVEVIDLLTPSPNCRIMSCGKKRRISDVSTVFIDLT
ncbi:Structure-specific endonuclease subunit SLX1-like [Melia azedarach]|uniref:Structure-specific endonuclease subunit SLX1-like n=1 Tax=Melia azedarach TaxID=155640 RepID=A0ACC1Y652_MELAZ|nr:Structure-specific endonuclease subunit SLX1-like [Melia azedarach]